MSTISMVVKTFVKTTVKSAYVSAVVGGAFLIGREIGKIEMGKKIEKSTLFGDVIIDREGIVKEPLGGEKEGDK